MRLPSIKHTVFINASVEKVFTTLSTADGWDSWFTSGMTLDIKTKLIHFVWKEFGAHKVSLTEEGPVLEVKKNKRFVFQWKPIGKYTTVTFTLKRKGKGAMLSVEETGYTKQSDLPTMILVATGWGEALTLLKFYLEYGTTYGKVP